MSLIIRRDGNGWIVEGETFEPGLAAGTRASAPLELDVRGASQLPVRVLDELRGYGRMLGEAVFVGDIRAIFHEVLDRVPHGDVLHVSLSVEDPELRSLRWERLCCPLHSRKDSPWEFLHLRQETAFSLDLRSAVDRRYPAISRVGLKALVVVADMGPTRPYKLADFDATETVAGIRAALGKDIPCHVLASSGESQLPSADGLPTLDEICRWLSRGQFAILHLVCHGEFKQWEEPGPDEKPVSKSDTFLYLRKPGEIDATRKDDHVARVSGTDLLQRLRQLQALPHLTFLCSCSSASTEAEQGLGGLGQRLVRELAMPAVVAMTDPVPIDLATEISTEFYHQLRETGEVDRALSKASAGQAGRPAILVPTHFSRLAGRRLFDDSPDLTTAEWEYGLNQLPALIQERAPVLMTTFEKLTQAIDPSLAIWKIGARTGNLTDDEKRARDTLIRHKTELNELCQGFLENSFDHLAKDKPLTFPTYDGRCPFPGLGVFDKGMSGDKEEDFRPFFFGRDQLIRDIRELLTRNRFVAVLGGSGSGKSSLVRAGLLEAMRREKPELRAIVFPPGKDPLIRMQTELATTPNPDILVVDQFEELFTLCTDLTQRIEYLKQLLTLRSRIPVVITMRADFLGECAAHDDLHTLLDAADDKHLKLIQPLKGNELRSVVELQAQAVGLKFEPGLAASIFDDLEGEPGAMPLLQHCLRQLWQYRHGRTLRLARYLCDGAQLQLDPEFRHVGGIKGAIARTAEDVYQQLVTDVPDAATLLPFIFERLARIDTSATDPEQRRHTRRREELTELTPAGSDAQVVKRIITKLANAKLVVTTQNRQTHETEAEVAHEALIHNWPRLQQWLDAARDTARLVERIRDDAGGYRRRPATDNLTLRGSVLTEAEALVAKVPPRLNKTGEQFVRDCRKHENALKDANDRRRTIIITGLISGLLLALVLASLSLSQWRIANSNFTIAESRRLASLSLRALDELLIDRALLLAAEAVAVSPTQEANKALAVCLDHDTRLVACLHGHNAAITCLRFSPDCRELASASCDGTINVWGIDEGWKRRHAFKIQEISQGEVQVAFDKGGGRLAYATCDGRIGLFDLSSGQAEAARLRQIQQRVLRPGSIDQHDGVAVCFIEDTVCAAFMSDFGVVRWNLVDNTLSLDSLEKPSLLTRLFKAPLGHRFGFSENARLLVGGVSAHSPDAPIPVGVITGWRTADGRIEFAMPTGSVESSSIAFHPTLKWVAAVQSSDNSRNVGISVLCPLNSKSSETLNDYNSLEVKERTSVNALGTNDDGTLLFSADENEGVSVWDMSQVPRNVGTLVGLREVTAIRGSGNSLVAAGNRAGALRIWNREACENEAKAAGELRKSTPEQLARSIANRQLDADERNLSP